MVKKSKTSKRELVYIVESYRDENQKIRQRIIKKCGELGELTAEDPDALEKIREEARRMTEEAAAKEVELTVDLNLPNDSSYEMVNYGYFFVESLYQSLKIGPFIDRHFDDPAEAKEVSSALKSYAIREFFSPLAADGTRHEPRFLFGLDDDGSKRDLGTIAKLIPFSYDLMKHIYRVANKGDECNDKVASLDITSYYFNSSSSTSRKLSRSDADAMRDLIMVQMGILYDRYRNPMACVVLEEGENETEAMLDAIERLKKKFGLDRIVITSDRGFGSNSALAALYESGNGYVVGRQVKSSPLSLQQAILDESGYRWNEAGTFKFKTFTLPRRIGNDVIPEKVISMWTSNNAARMKQQRDKIIVDFLSNPRNYSMDEFPEIEKYVVVHDATETPGEDIDQNFFSFDSESYARDMALDGYYALVTTELDIPESVIIKRYHNLQKMHRAFAAPDADIEGEPRRPWTIEEVKAYFIVSFVSLVMEHKLLKMLGSRYTSEQVKTALRQATCKNIGQDIYDLNVQSDVFHDIEDAFGVRFDKAYATLEMLRKYRREVINAL